MIFKYFYTFLLVTCLCLQNVDLNSAAERTDSEEENVFNPTYDWQIIKKDQPIPKGLHVRINLQTGLKEAKLLDPTDDTNKGNALSYVQPTIEFKEDESEATANKYTTDELKHVLKNIKNDETILTDFDNDEIVKEQFKSYAQLKQELGDLNLSLKSDNEILKDLFNEYDNIHSDGDLPADEKTIKIVNILKDIEYLVHQIDNANDFINLGGFANIVYSNLNNSNLLIKCEALNILGSTVQNNAKAQIHGLETGSIDKLIKILALDNPQEAKLRAVYSLSSLLRRFPLAQSKFLKNGGLNVFSTIFIKPEDNKIQLKIITLLYDLLIEHKDALANIKSFDYKEKIKQYYLVDLKSKLIEFDWCKTFNTFFINNLLIEKNDHDTVEKCLNFMVEIVDNCRETLKNEQLIRVLTELRTNYEKLADEEEKEHTEDDVNYYFNNLKQITYNLLTIIDNNHKAEL